MLNLRVLSIFLSAALLISCGSSAEQKTIASSGPPPFSAPSKAAATAPLPFNPAAITPEVFLATKNDVIDFVNRLNVIIKNQNYAAWSDHLSASYLQSISAPDFLKAKSNTEILRSKNIVLETPRDYFFNVVVPSRYHDRVDDISFISQNRVKAYTLVKGQRLRLYDLEKVKGEWYILN
ncbi:MAG: hypothetical protein Ta2G_11300 [Termitinemataceae bacterium]|nr:MAG: hypothetical protein Ta2G_11300 [Termitinemataceae bacterium]